MSLWVAVGFLTRISVGDPSAGGSREVNVAGAVPWFPVVGALIGAIQAAIWWGLAQGTTPLVAAAVSTTVAALITGAFHHDGLADMADAFGGGWTAEQRMEILKDSRLGTYGTSALVLAFGLEIAALSSFEPVDGALALIAMHMFGRALAVLTMLRSSVAGDGLGAAYTRDIPRIPAMASVIGAGIVTAACLGTSAFAILPAMAAATAVVILSHRKIGGITGDVLGAITVVSGVTLLVAATIQV